MCRNLKISSLPRIFADAVRDSAVILIIIESASAGNRNLTYDRVPNDLTDWLLGNVESETAFSSP